MMMKIPNKDLAIFDFDEGVSLLPGPLNAVDFQKKLVEFNLYPRQHHHHRFAAEEWYWLCALHGSERLSTCVDIDPDVRGGVPVLRGTRFTVSEALAEIADSDAIEDVSRNFDLELSSLRELLSGLSLLLNHPYSR
jgi:uncharacterized protein (DUF433 family)